MQRGCTRLFVLVLIVLFTPRVVYEYLGNLKNSIRPETTSRSPTTVFQHPLFPRDHLEAPVNETTGYKVLEFIQACYMPSNLSVCGVNLPVFYLTKGSIGSPSQPFQAIVDINSFESLFATCNTLTECPVSSSKNFFTCVYPTYDANISFSFNYQNTSYFSNFVNSGSNDLSTGCWGWDNITYGSDSKSISLPYMEFPLVNPPLDANYFEAIIGLGLDLIQSRDLFLSDKERERYYNSHTQNMSTSLINTMAVYKEVNSKVYSIWVNDNGVGQIIFGGIDKGKIASKGLTFFENLQYKFFTSSLMSGSGKFKLYRPYISLDYVLLDGLTNYKAKTKLYQVYDAVIESTERGIYGPRAIIKSFAKKYGLKNENNRYYINCTRKGQPLFLSFANKLNISVPWEDLIFKNLDPTTNKKTNQDCVWGLNYKNNQDYWVLGQTFMNNIYFYSDLVNQRYGIAPVNRTGDSLIEIQSVKRTFG